MIRILTGAPGTGKTRYLMQQIKQEVGKGHEVLYLTKPQSTHEMERRLVRDVLPDGFMHVQVLDLDRLAQKILDETGGYAGEHMSTLGQVLAVRSILQECAEELTVFRRAWSQRGFSTNVAKQLDDLEKWQITADDLEEASKSVSQQQLREKLLDLARIKRTFDMYCEEKNCAKSNIRAAAASQMHKMGGWDSTVCFLDDVQNEDPSSMALIMGLLARCKDSCLTVTYDAFAKEEIRYAAEKRKLDRYEVRLKDAGMPYETIRFAPKEDAQGELAFLRANLFSVPIPRYKGEKTGAVQLFVHTDPRREAERVAQQILYKCRKENLRYRDFTVLCASGEEGFQQIQQAFARYGIPAFYDMRRKLAGSATASLLHRLIQMGTNAWDSKTVVNILKSELTCFDYDEACKLENFVLKHGISGHRRWMSPWRTKDAQEMEPIRQKVVAMFTDYILAIMNNASTGERVQAIFDILDRLGVREKLEEKVILLQEEGASQDAMVTAQIWRVLCEIMGQLSHVLGSEFFNIREFDAILTEGILSTELGTIPSTMDQVTVSTIERYNAEHTPVLFLIGATEDALTPKEDLAVILHDEDVIRLRDEAMLQAGPDPQERMDEYKADLFHALSACYRELQISYPRQALNEDTQNPAHLMIQLETMFGIGTEHYSTESPVSVFDGFSKWAYASYLKSRGRKVPAWTEEAETWFSQHEPWTRKKQQVEKLLGIQQETAAIEPELVREMLGSPAKLSATALEKYAGCPFSYFMQAILYARARDEYEAGAVADTGTVIHEILNRLGDEILEKKIEPKKMDEEACENWTRSAFDTFDAQSDYYAALSATASGKAIRERLVKNAKAAVWNVIRSLNCSSFDLKEVEYWLPNIQLSTEAGEAVLQGRIDRVDVAKLPGGDAVRIIDYKSSSKNTDLSEIYYGQRLQLAAYMLSLVEQPDKIGSERLTPAGMLYFPVGDRNTIREEESKMAGIIDQTEEIQEAMDHERDEKGKSAVVAPVSTRKVKGQVDHQTMELLLDYTKKELHDLAQHILEGDMRAEPAWPANRNARGCAWCDYAGVCGFDERIRPLQVHRMPPLEDEKTVEAMKRDTGKETGEDAADE